MKKRLFISLDFPPENGGIQNYVYGIVTHLDPKHTVVLTSNRMGKSNYLNFDSRQKYKTFRINLNNKVSFLKQILQLVYLFIYIYKIKRENQTEELHFGNIMPIGLVGPLALKFLGLKYYPYIHGLDFLESKNNPLKYKLIKYCLSHSAKIICNSNYTKNMLKESGIEDSKLTVVHPGIPLLQHDLDYDKEHLLEKYDLKEKFVLMTVGRLVKRKGHDKVIESLKQLRDINPNIKYIICGNGPEKKNLELQVKSSNMEKYVIFSGDIEREELDALYSIADLFIMLNREIKEEGDVEGFGIVFLEAAIHRLPVIGGNNGGVPDAVLHGETGFLIDSTNVKEIVHTISSFFYDKELSKKMGENGYKWVSEKCLWSHRVSLLETLEG